VTNIDCHIKLDASWEVVIIGVARAELAAIVQPRAIHVLVIGDEEDALGGRSHPQKMHCFVVCLDRHQVLAFVRIDICPVAQLAKVVPTARAYTAVLVQDVTGFPDRVEGEDIPFLHWQHSGFEDIFACRIEAQLTVFVAPRKVYAAVLAHEQRV